jgi:tripartite-type tricarboxylate transporter receptor subunit TctC
MPSRRQVVARLGASAAALAMPALRAQDARPLRIVIPFAAGGSSDAMARLLATPLQAELGRPVIVDPTPGGSGLLAARKLLNAPADGTMLLNISPTTMIILPKTTKIGFDPHEEFVPVTNMGSNPLVLGVHRSVPVTTLGEFIDWVKARPAKSVNYASGGTGTSTHLVAELFFRRAGLQLNHVPYKGGAPALQDLLAGHVSAYFGNPAEFLAHLGSGHIRVLATSGEKRLPELPNTPALNESIPNLSLVTWNGLAFRKGTAREDVERASLAVQKVSRLPDYIAGMHKIGISPIGDSPAQFAATIRRDRLLWDEAIELAGLKPE